MMGGYGGGYGMGGYGGGVSGQSRVRYKNPFKTMGCIVVVHLVDFSSNIQWFITSFCIFSTEATVVAWADTEATVVE
jgi:hypothetical protein